MRALVVAGATLYALAGAVMGAQNVGWLDERNTNNLLPLLGVGLVLIAVGVRKSALHHELRSSLAGRLGGYVVVLGAVLYVVSWAIDFAIFGTLTVALGLIVVSVAFWVRQLHTIPDRVLVTLSAIGSLTWNTETASAFLLVGVGLIWIVLAIRMLEAEQRA